MTAQCVFTRRRRWTDSQTTRIRREVPRARGRRITLLTLADKPSIHHTLFLAFAVTKSIIIMPIYVPQRYLYMSL